VGLVLPVAPGKEGPRLAETSGVLSGPKTPWGRVFYALAGRTTRRSGYFVDTRAALEVLARHAPEAAAWWEQNAPHLLQPGRQFLFRTEVCQEI
jgi:hypothetical protein